MKKVFLAVFLCLLLMVSFGETKPDRKPLESIKTDFSYKLDLSDWAVYKGNLMSTDVKWFDTGIYIKKGMNFSINANGYMAVSGESFDKVEVFGNCTPKGMDSNVNGFYYGLLRGRVLNLKTKSEYFFHVGEGIKEINVQHEGQLEISVLPTPWVKNGMWATPSGVYNVHISLR
jgi:hypothetical protein